MSYGFFYVHGHQDNSAFAYETRMLFSLDLPLCAVYRLWIIIFYTSWLVNSKSTFKDPGSLGYRPF